MLLVLISAGVILLVNLFLELLGLVIGILRPQVVELFLQ